MLIVGRRTSQKIIIADDIEITILEVGRNRVRFGIEAPKDIPIHTKLQRLPEADSGDVTAEPEAKVVAPPSSDRTS